MHNFSQCLCSLNSINDAIAVLESELLRLNKETESKRKEATPDTEALERDFRRKLLSHDSEAESDLVAFESKIKELQVKSLHIKSDPCKVDRNTFLKQASGQLEQIAEMESLFNEASNKFDSLFGGSTARNLIEQKFLDELQENPSEAYVKLVDSSKRAEQINASLNNLNTNIHDDSYSRILNFVFPNLHEVFPNLSAQILLGIYFYTILVFMALAVYFPDYLMLPLGIFLVVAILSSMQKYTNIIKAFLEVLQVKALAQNAEMFINMGVDEEVEEAERKLREKRDENLAVNEDSIKMAKQNMADFADNMENKKEEYREKLAKELEIKKEELSESLKPILAEYEALKAESEQKLNALNCAKEEKKSILRDLMLSEGVGSPQEVRDELFNPKFLLGIDEVTGEPEFLDISEPVRVLVEPMDKITLVNALVSQLMLRMAPRTFRFVIYDTDNAGHSFLHYLTRESENDSTFTILDSKEKFDAYIKTLKSETSKFLPELASFGDMSKYNEYMFSIGSVVRASTIFLMLNNVKGMDITGLTKIVGVYWVNLDSELVDRDNNKIKDQFEISIPVIFQNSANQS